MMNRVARGFAFGLGAIGAVLIAGDHLAWAQSPACDEKTSAPPMTVVDSCSKLIQSKKLTGAGLGDIYRKRGFNYIRNKNYAFAKQDFDQAIKLNPNDDNAYGMRAVVHFTAQRYDQSIADYSVVIQRNPKHAGALNQRGRAYLEKGMNDRALQDFEAAIKLQPNNPEFTQNKARALLRMIQKKP